MWRSQSPVVPLSHGEVEAIDSFVLRSRFAWIWLLQGSFALCRSAESQRGSLGWPPWCGGLGWPETQWLLIVLSSNMCQCVFFGEERGRPQASHPEEGRLWNALLELLNRASKSSLYHQFWNRIFTKRFNKRADCPSKSCLERKIAHFLERKMACCVFWSWNA